jgi:hypothetical protein
MMTENEYRLGKKSDLSTPFVCSHVPQTAIHHVVSYNDDLE